MRRFLTTKFRFVLLAALLGAAVLMATNAYAQTPAAPGAPGTTVIHKQNAFSLVLDNIDFVFIIILLCSIGGVTLIIQGIIKNRRSVFMPDATTEMIRQMITERKFKELIEFTENDPSFISKALNPALKRAPSFSSMKEAMETSIGENTAEQFRKIEYLNILGNLGPLLGLLGTVLGMIDSFQAMSASGGNASPAELAAGISKALCHTMLGLLLAVPCLAAFGVLRTVVDRLTVQGALVCEELLLMIKPAEAKPGATPVRPGATPQPAAAAKKPMVPGVPAPTQA